VNVVDTAAQQQRYGTARAVFLSASGKLVMSEGSESIYSIDMLDVKIRLCQRTTKPLPFGNVVRSLFSVLLSYKRTESCQSGSIGVSA
jgi:hypothetical protein